MADAPFGARSRLPLLFKSLAAQVGRFRMKQSDACASFDVVSMPAHAGLCSVCLRSRNGNPRLPRMGG